MHQLLISLPPEKFNWWIAELNAVLDTAQRMADCATMTSNRYSTDSSTPPTS